MSGPHLLRAATRPVTPWRNGGGNTSEVARRPTGSGSWRWRVSIATISQDGPFSPFPGYDRLLVPLDGAVRLVVGGTVMDVPTLTALRFPGEEAVEAIDVSGPTTDLNVIVARDRGTADVQVVSARGTRFGPGPEQLHLVVALSDEVETDVGPLTYLDAVQTAVGGELTVHDGLIAAIRITG